MTVMSAARQGNLARLEKLLALNPKSANDRRKRGWTPLHLAAWGGHRSSVRCLLSRGAFVNAKSDNGETPLHSAAWSGHTACARLLLLHGADLNAKDKGGETPLHWAAWKGHTSVAKLLLDSGAQINAKDERDNATPLHYAAWRGHMLIVKLLLAYGADVHARDLGCTPAKWAAENRHGKVARLLSQCAGENRTARRTIGRAPPN
jgi:ankyrin repeat protein